MRAVEEVVAAHQQAGEQLLRTEVEQVRQEIQRQAQRIIEFSRSVEIRDRRDLMAAGERSAAMDSARFAHAHMASARCFPDPAATLDYGLARP
jgi:hypothetical protein